MLHFAHGGHWPFSNMADDRYSQLDVEHEESFDLPSTGAVRARPGATATPPTTTTENKLTVNNKKYLEAL